MTITVNPGTFGSLPADPSSIATSLPTDAATDLFTATRFLYTGDNPIQTGVAENTIDRERVAVLRGKVTSREGAPLPGVALTILDHPELGATRSRVDGMFDMVVNGGGTLIVNYAKEGYLPAQRRIETLWQEYARLEDVALIPLDTTVTLVDLAATIPMQVARGSQVSDSNGVRRHTLLFPQGTAAEMTLPDGASQPLTRLHVRSTEYTVGSNGPATMPGELPPTSAYTYAQEFSADEAIAAGATSVRFSQPIISYNENFLKFPVGMTIPVGSYDRSAGVWVPSENGRVVKILSITNGKADLDVEGAGTAATPAELARLGVTDAERATVASLYSAGQSLWRVPTSHFSPADLNWPPGLPEDAEPPNLPEPKSDKLTEDPVCRRGSIIECQNQVLRESIPITGTPFRLHYRSDRVPGRAASYTLRIPLSEAPLPPGLRRIELEVWVAGRRFAQQFPAAPNQSTRFTWDGRDAYGRMPVGKQPITVRIGYTYATTYGQPTESRNSFATVSGVPIPSSAREEATLWQEWFGQIGVWNAAALGGWTLSVHNTYDPDAKVLYLGNGNWRGTRGGMMGSGSITNLDELFPPIAGTGEAGFSGDGGPATRAQLNSPAGIIVAPDGSLYIADERNHRIRHVDTKGIITTIAGTGQRGYSGDGGPARQAQLSRPRSIAVALDGSLYISDAGNHRIRKVQPHGVITTVAGTTSRGFSGDGGPATQAQLNSPSAVAATPDGSLYIADQQNHRVRRVGTDGMISTVAGTGEPGSSGDGGPATRARLGSPRGVAVGPEGSLYIISSDLETFRRVRPDGVISTISDEMPDLTEDAMPALWALLNAYGIATAPGGSFYMSMADDHRVRRVGLVERRSTTGEILIASEDGSEVYVFSDAGRHLRTLDALTGAMHYQFNYDSAGHLTAVADGDSNVAHIERDTIGNPSAIVGPYGQRTSVALDSNGFLARITNPAGESIQLGSTDHGLLTSFTSPGGETYRFNYDTLGRLIRDEDPAGGFTTLTRTDADTSRTVSVSTALNRTTNYRLTNRADGSEQQVNALPSGLRDSSESTPDGSRVSRTSDGVGSMQSIGPDPRWGMFAPVADSVVFTTPSGLRALAKSVRAASLANSNDLFSLETLTQIDSVNGRASSTTYIGASRTLTTVTPTGRQSVTRLDARGRPVQVQVPGVLPIDISYDARGRLASIRQGSGPAARVARFEYNAAGYLSSIVDPLMRTTRFAYDVAGRVIRKTLADGRVIDYTHDANGKVTSVAPAGRPAHIFGYTPVGLPSAYDPPDVLTGPDQTHYAYNADRQLIRVTRPNGQTIDASYDTAGRLKSIVIPSGTLSYAYHPTSGKLVRVAAPGGIGITESFDGALLTGRAWSGPVPGAVDYTYDNNFRLISTSVNGSNTISFRYDNDGLLTQAGGLTLTRNAQNGFVISSRLGGLTDTLSYDGFGAPKTYSADFAGARLYEVQYTRDQIGRITSKVETISGGTAAYAYAYDVAGRLAEVKQNDTIVATYTYDSNNNRLGATKQGNLTSGSYDIQDRLTQYGNAIYSYTLDGELESKTLNGQTAAYEYDALGSLVAVTLPSGPTIKYLIDGQRRRIGKLVNGRLVQSFLYLDDLRPVAELDDEANVVSRFVYAHGRHVPSYMVRQGATYRIITDQLGSPRLVVNTATGEIAQRIDYDEFGRITLDTKPGFQPFGFAGGLYDPDTELTRFGARDYDPETGRWTAKDPLLFNAEDTNLYGYVFNDPVNQTDPSGLTVVGIGPSAEVQFWGGAEVALYVVFDMQGGVGIMLSPAARFGPDVALSIGGSGFVNFAANSIEDLSEWGVSLGVELGLVSACVPVSLSIAQPPAPPMFGRDPFAPISPYLKVLPGVGVNIGKGMSLGAYIALGYSFVWRIR